jgi:hypothetical protein
LRLPATTLQIVTALLFFAAICPNWDSWSKGLITFSWSVDLVPTID